MSKESCDDIKQSFFVRKLIVPITILINIGLTVYFTISNYQNYNIYQNRATYVVYHVPNTTSNYYIIRANLNDTVNCSSNSLFNFDVTSVYQDIINKDETGNLLFVVVYWLSTIVAGLLSLSDIILSITSHCIQHHNDDIEFDERVPLFTHLLVRSVLNCYKKVHSYFQLILLVFLILLNCVYLIILQNHYLFFIIFILVL